MATAAAVTVPSLQCRYKPLSFSSSFIVVSQKKNKNPSFNFSIKRRDTSPDIPSSGTGSRRRRRSIVVFSELDEDSNQNKVQDEQVNSLGVKAALSMLNFYKREISPILPKSCRYVPTCSEYSMQAYKKYGVAKGTILTAWRLCRCNPLGGSGYDPPIWFDERKTPEQ